MDSLNSNLSKSTALTVRKSTALVAFNKVRKKAVIVFSKSIFVSFIITFLNLFV